MMATTQVPYSSGPQRRLGMPTLAWTWQPSMEVVGLWGVGAASPSAWQGTDEKIDQIATAAGHPPREPLFNADQGDLMLFLFLIAGAIGGFIVGYFFRALFPPRRREVGRNG